MNGKNAIPFLDLVTPHRELAPELTEVFTRVLNTAGFIGGLMLEQFENAFAEFCQTKYCVGVSSGTDALRFALMAGGVKFGDIVITVPNTFIATTEAISQAGAKPRFVDVDERTYNMDPVQVRKYVTECCSFDSRLELLIDNRSGKPVTAIVPVHLYGQMADMDELLEIAEQYHLNLIEDACQAHGAQYFSRKENRWRTAGSMGIAAAFSFYPGKNLGACGEAGAATTNDEMLARKMRMLRDHGQGKKYYHDMEGYNGRLDSIQAGLLHVKLKHLANWNQSRQERARKYNELLSAANADIKVPYEPSWSKAIYHLYVVQVENREVVQAALAAEGIGTGIHYPIPLHLQKAYTNQGYRTGDFPLTEKAAERILSLPIFPTLSEADQVRIVETLVRIVQDTQTHQAAAVSI